jgi:pimeloyl-ACP methyl ester carboxylesterase
MAVLVAVAVAPGCTYLRMLFYQERIKGEFQNRPSLRLLEQLVPDDTFQLEGQLDGLGEGEGQLLVAAISGALMPHEVVATHLIGPWPAAAPATYSLLVPSGAYDVLVFADLNGDGRFEAKELVGRTPDGARVLVGGPQAEDGYTVRGPNIKVDRSRPADCGFTFKVDAAGRGHRFASLSTAFFDPMWGERGLYRPMDFLLHTQGVLFGLDEEPDASKVQVVFVHGMVGTPRDFAYLVDGLDRRRYQPWFVFYPSGLPLAQTSRMVERVLQLLAEGGAQSVVLVGHSMGGVISREALNRLCVQERPAWLKGFVSISAIFGGSEDARVGARQSPFVPPAWRDVATGSDFLKELNRQSLPADLPYWLLFGWGNDKAHGPGAAGDGRVPLHSQLTSAAQAEATRMVGFEETHTGILNDREARETFLQALAAMAVQPPPKLQ